jgi:hypothetical protein
MRERSESPGVPVVGIPTTHSPPRQRHRKSPLRNGHAEPDDCPECATPIQPTPSSASPSFGPSAGALFSFDLWQLATHRSHGSAGIAGHVAESIRRAPRGPNNRNAKHIALACSEAPHDEVPPSMLELLKTYAARDPERRKEIAALVLMRTPAAISILSTEFDLTFGQFTRRCETVWRQVDRMGLKVRSTRFAP